MRRPTSTPDAGRPDRTTYACTHQRLVAGASRTSRDAYSSEGDTEVMRLASWPASIRTEASPAVRTTSGREMLTAALPARAVIASVQGRRVSNPSQRRAVPASDLTSSAGSAPSGYG